MMLKLLSLLTMPQVEHNIGYILRTGKESVERPFTPEKKEKENVKR